MGSIEVGSAEETKILTHCQATLRYVRGSFLSRIVFARPFQ